jgi:hypothetical protein
MAASRDENLKAAMHYNELLARRIVTEVARISVDGLQPVLLHEVARRLKIDEASPNPQCIGLLPSVGWSLRAHPYSGSG